MFISVDVDFSKHVYVISVNISRLSTLDIKLCALEQLMNLSYTQLIGMCLLCMLHIVLLQDMISRIHLSETDVAISLL